MKKWYQQESAEVLKELKTGYNGLTTPQAESFWKKMAKMFCRNKNAKVRFRYFSLSLLIC